MSIDRNNDRNNAESNFEHTDIYYEQRASQEEECLDETAEKLRETLIAEEQSADENKNPLSAEGVDEELEHAAEELITGDSDDPPLSDEAEAETLKSLRINR